MTRFTEDTLVQRTTAEYLEQKLGWESVYAYNNEDFGPNSLLGRASDHEVVLTRILRRKLAELNPGLPDAAYERRSVAVTSNLHPSGFDTIMPKTIATAAVDRLLHHAHVVVTEGTSLRLTDATNGKGVMPLG